MNEPINHIGNIANPLSYRTLSSIPVEQAGSNTEKDLPKSSSKYILENKKIVFERYDSQGKLISRVPWTANRVSERV